MRTFRDAKAMAKSLRQALERRQVDLSHSECLELVAQQFGVDNWNILAARIQAADAGVRLRPAVPVLRVFAVDKAKEFYRDFLGFTLDWEHRFAPDLPWYAQVSRSGLSLHLSEHHGDGTPGATVFVWMAGIEEFHQELIDKKYRYARPGIEAAPWDSRVLNLVDPFGNQFRFSEPDGGDRHRGLPRFYHWLP